MVWVWMELIAYSKTQPPAAPYVIDSDSEDLSNGSYSRRDGVVRVDGDGTVPLASLGFMCRRGWRSKTLNPSGSPTLTLEYGHNVTVFPQECDDTSEETAWQTAGRLSADVLNVLRKPDKGDHVDLLGAEALINDVLQLACGRGDTLKDRVASDIDAISEQIARDIGLD